MVLNDLELEILSTKAMRFTEKEAIKHLETKGYHMSSRTYYRALGHISAETTKRAFEIAKSFLEDHINTCDELENIKKLMYKNYKDETRPINKTMILVRITEMIPYITAYREATKKIIEKVKKEVGNQEKVINLSTIGV